MFLHTLYTYILYVINKHVEKGRIPSSDSVSFSFFFFLLFTEIASSAFSPKRSKCALKAVLFICVKKNLKENSVLFSYVLLSYIFDSSFPYFFKKIYLFYKITSNFLFDLMNLF